MIMEYFLTGGCLQIGKKEAMFELLRKDSVLRPLLGDGIQSMLSKSGHANAQGDFVTIDLRGIAERKLSGDPAGMLSELKARYGSAVSGKLCFRSFYTTFAHTYYYEIDISADQIATLPVE